MRVQVLAAAIVAATLSSPASATIYDCAIKVGAQHHGWLPDQVIVDTNSNGKVMVIDPIIQGTVGAPIEANLAQDSATRSVFSWTSKLSAMDNTYVKMMFRLSVQKTALTSHISARPLGYDNSFEAEGTCSAK